MKTRIALLGMVALFSAMAFADMGAAPQWDKGVVRMFATLPVQDGGRVKPLDTLAGFKLLKFNGRRACANLEGKSLTPIAWLLDCLFYPEVARQYKMFRVDDSAVMTALGLPSENKRDRYSYDAIAPARAKLSELAEKYMSEPEQQRTPLESQIVNLDQNVHEFEGLIHYLDFARQTFPTKDNPVLAALFPGQTEINMSTVLTKAPEISEKFLALKHGQEKSPALDALSKFLHQLDSSINRSGAIALFPPADPAEKEWLSPVDIFERAFGARETGAKSDDLIGLLASLENVMVARGDQAAFRDKVAAFHKAVVDVAKARGEYGKIGLEVTYYRLQLIYYSLIFYVLSFIIIACSWLKVRSRFLSKIAPVSVALPTALLIAGIAIRCVIRGRPPVTTLYETILFVTAVVVVVALFMEYVNRQRIALALGSVLGMLGIFLAYKYEVREGSDTMPSMVAVLDTNFWLATHVTTITIGYAAGLLAGAMAHVYVIGKLFKLKRNDPEFYKTLTRMVYGVICFGLLFSVVGTVLGGIWANESWGRFWGWDPKENGALMIVLWLLAILHARMGGIIRDFGLNMAAIIGGVIVAFSWFGVNLLGVGLHSYGFTSGTYNTLMLFYIVEAVFLFLGGVAWLRQGQVSGLGSRVSG